jgi:hypothetical protein
LGLNTIAVGNGREEGGGERGMIEREGREQVLLSLIRSTYKRPCLLLSWVC